MGKKTPVNVEVKPRHRDEPIERLIKRFMKKVKNERIIVKNKRNDCFMINKFCPHQKANLTYAQINDKNELICPAHGWRFNLEKDGVDEKSTLSIKSIALKKEEN